MSVAVPVVDTWDGLNRRIYLKQGVSAFHWMDDIYVEYRQERRLNEDFRKWEPFLVASGNVSKGLGKATPRLVTLLLGTKVIPWNEANEIQVGGEAITDNADVDATLFDISTITFPVIINYNPPSAEVIVVDSIAKSLDYNGILHYDADAGFSGQDHPIGTAAKPVNNILDGLVIAELYSLSSVSTRSNITMDRDIDKFQIESKVPNLIMNPNGFKMDLCQIKDMVINGNFNGSLMHFKECEIKLALNVHGKIKDSYLEGDISITDGGDLVITDSESGAAGETHSHINMGVGKNTTLSVRNFSGGLSVENCDTPLCVATLEINQGKLHIHSDNTAGYISLRGSAALVDESTGTTIDTSALFQPQKLTDLHKLQGLDPLYPMTVTPTTRSVDDINIDIAGDGENVSVVTRQ